MVIAAALGQIQLLFCFGALGLLSSIIGVLVARVGKHGDPGKALNGGTYLTCGIFAALTLAACLIWNYELRLWGAAIIGMLAGVPLAYQRLFYRR